MERQLITLSVNGERHVLAVPVYKTLLEVLREDLHLTGTKHGCELGECGACTVLVDGEPVLSCLALPIELEGREILTIEGVMEHGRPHPLQIAFAETGAVQCGYCTPGFVLAAKALLEKNPSPTRQEITDALSGNLCRCTGYLQIFEAVERAAARMREERAETRGGPPERPACGRMGGSDARVRGDRETVAEGGRAVQVHGADAVRR